MANKKYVELKNKANEQIKQSKNTLIETDQRDGC